MRSHLAFSQLSLDCRRSSSYSLSFFPVTFLILHSLLPCFLKRECFVETRKSVVKKLAANLRFIGSVLYLPDLDEGGGMRVGGRSLFLPHYSLIGFIFLILFKSFVKF